MTMILSGRVMGKDETAQILASLEARAELAEENGLPRTAKCWREAATNLNRAAGSADCHRIPPDYTAQEQGLEISLVRPLAPALAVNLSRAKDAAASLAVPNQHQEAA
jgi:hypothetical protein